jgi:hypothetical protein
MKFVSITHSKRNISNGRIVATTVSRETRKPVWKEMAASPTERIWYVLEFARCNSFVVVQRAFRLQFGRRGHYMKLQKFLVQMVVTSCISVQYL